MNRRQLLTSASGLLGAAALNSLQAAEKRSGARFTRSLGTAPATVCLSDFETLAKQRMPHAVFEFIASGAADEITIRWNREAFDRLRLRTRVLLDVDRLDTRVTLFGQEMPHPILLAPTAFHRLSHPEGEVATARGAGLASATFVVSSFSTRRIEDIARVAKAPLWFQLYGLRKERREFVRGVVQEAEASGCGALVVTVDAPTLGARNRLERTALRIPDPSETPYYPDRDKAPTPGGIPMMGGFTWADVEWLLSMTRLPVLLKGIMNPDDAERAVRTGVAGIIVSNHGGRCLDTQPATVTVLPRIVDKVAGRVPILVDGGIRRGTDVLKTLALGAKAILIGRPYCYGLAVAGADGVAHVVNILRKELEMAMALTGRAAIASLDRSVLWE